MIPPLQSALSGLFAAATNLRANADNIANLGTEGFHRTRVLQTSAASGGVRSVVEKVATPGQYQYEETNNGSELVELSNVDLASELPNLNLNKIMYKASLKTIQTADEMLGNLLQTKA
ncbi:MAG: flagellar biosynthesis protein FlgC [Desulfofustis sp.]|nr:flagellar biosynthesis protein FlgC [Desulfofustis sp.]